MVLFDDVDVAVLVEHVIDGERIPCPHIVRAANRKAPAEIDVEIRAAQTDRRPLRSSPAVRAAVACAAGRSSDALS